jgi:hypothetical protein
MGKGHTESVKSAESIEKTGFPGFCVIYPFDCGQPRSHMNEKIMFFPTKRAFQSLVFIGMLVGN